MYSNTDLHPRLKHVSRTQIQFVWIRDSQNYFLRSHIPGHDLKFDFHNFVVHNCQWSHIYISCNYEVDLLHFAMNGL